MPLPHPYAHIEKDSDMCSRLQVDVDKVDKALITAVHIDRGIISFILGETIKTLCNDLRTHGITYYSPDNAARLVAIVRQRTNREFALDGRNKTIGLREVGVCEATERTEKESADSVSPTTSGVSPQRTKEKTKRR